MGKRCHERYVIAGLIAGGYRYLSRRKAIELIQMYGHQTSEHKVRTAIQELIDMGWIYEVEKGYYCDRIASKYNVTDKFKHVCLNSRQFYSSISAYRNNKPIKWEKDAIISAPSYEQQWRSILPADQYTDEFISSLLELENHQVHFDRESAFNAYYNGITDPKNYMPHYYRAQLGYYPLKTGRLQSKPHVYLGKALVPFITPLHDKALKQGTLFSLDYRSQELRIVGNMTEGRLMDDLNQQDDIFGHIHSQLSPLLQDTISSVKQPIYAMTYGSTGRSMADELVKQGAPRDTALSLANDFINEFNGLYPEIKQLQKDSANTFVKEGKLTAPGGVTRHPDQGNLTKKGKVKKSYANRVALSHMVQGKGAKITRDVVTKSPRLGFSRLHIPIHDGFVFYTENNVDLAISEATQLMADCAEIDIPVKLEWKRDREMLHYA